MASTYRTLPTAAESGAKQGWWVRAVMPGYIASTVTLFAFLVADALARALGAPAERGAATTFENWLYALTHNQVTDLGQSSLYLSLAIYFAGGLLWAVVYARFAEPHLPGAPWLRGMLFSLLPAAVSLLVVLPVLGGGLLGLGLNAGPLPIVGNVLLNLIYGAVLGLLYGPFGQLSAEDFGPGTPENARAMAAAQRTAGLSIIGGLIIGVIVGLGGMLVAEIMNALLLGAAPAAFLFASILAGTTLGALVGSLLGLPDMQRSTA